MDIDWSDPAWWSAISAALAFLVALISFFTACKAASAASRSAKADELATTLAKGLSRTCHVRWEMTHKGTVFSPAGDGNYRPEDYGRATMTNKGEEVALNVHVTGDVSEHKPVAKVQPGESFTFDYDALTPDDGKKAFIGWDRPEEFGDERMSVRRDFF